MRLADAAAEAMGKLWTVDSRLTNGLTGWRAPCTDIDIGRGRLRAIERLEAMERAPPASLRACQAPPSPAAALGRAGAANVLTRSRRHAYRATHDNTAVQQPNQDDATSQHDTAQHGFITAPSRAG